MKIRKILKFIIDNGIEYVAVSYVHSGRDIENIREEIKKLKGENIKIISKIETKLAIQNIDEIIELSDYIMIARGDLDMNFNLEEIPRLQKIHN